MNEPPDEPAGLSSQKNGSAISPKSYPPASFCTTGGVLELGRGNFRIGERMRVISGCDIFQGADILYTIAVLFVDFFFGHNNRSSQRKL